jgi:hypothetical protein
MSLRDEVQHLWETAAKPFNELWAWAKKPKDMAERAIRWDELADWAAEHAKVEHHHHDEDSSKEWRKKSRIYRKRAKACRNESTAGDVPGMEAGGWHPDARRVGVVSGIGPLQHPVCGLLHTTEGFGLPNYVGTNPHCTLDPLHNVLYQHQTVLEGARALQNLSGGVETNRKCIQLEIIAFAGQSQNWSEETYDNIADWMRWVEKHCGVKPTFDGLSFPGGGQTAHMSSTQWNAYDGWAGHCNVPENLHWDPGAIKKDLLLPA